MNDRADAKFAFSNCNATRVEGPGWMETPERQMAGRGIESWPPTSSGCWDVKLTAPAGCVHHIKLIIPKVSRARGKGDRTYKVN